MVPSEHVWRISASDDSSLNRPLPDTEARLTPAPSSNSRHRLALSALVMSTVSALNESRRVRRPATVVKPPAPSEILTSRSLPFWAVMLRVPYKISRRLGYRAEAHQRVIGAPVGLAPDIGRRETEIDEVMIGQRQRRIVERLEQRAGDDVRLVVPALARPGMQRHLVLLARLAAGGEIGNARFAERHIRKGRVARRLVVNFRAAENGRERGIGSQRV